MERRNLIVVLPLISLLSACAPRPPANDGERKGTGTESLEKKVPFASYYYRVQFKVKPFWEARVSRIPLPEIEKKDYVTSVNVTMTALGQVQSVAPNSSSGVPALDDAVITAFSEAGDFPSPPPAMIGKDRLAHLDGVVFTVSHKSDDDRSYEPWSGIRAVVGSSEVSHSPN
jgi:TonB C terminal